MTKIYEQQKEWAIKGAVGVAACVLCYAVMIHPIFPGMVTLRQNIIDSQKRRELYREVQNLTDSLSGSERVLATLTERSQLLAKISDIAGGNGISVETLTPRTEPDGAYVKLRMQMEGRGDFFAVIKFLQAVEKIGDEIQVAAVSIMWKPSVGPQEDRDPLLVKIVFETLLLQQAAKKNNV